MGWSSGSINASYASGNATLNITYSFSYDYAGGLVGYNNNGTITQSYATGSVAGVSAAGGLVGGNGGTVTTSEGSRIAMSG